MFTENLTDIQQGFLLGLTKKLVSIDGVITPEESVMLNAIQKQISHDE